MRDAEDLLEINRHYYDSLWSGARPVEPQGMSGALHPLAVLALCFTAALPAWASPGAAAGAAPPAARSLSLAVLDLELSGDLGGPDFEAEHAARLRTESARLRSDLAAAGLYRMVDTAPAQREIDVLKSQQQYLHDCNGCDLDVGRQLGADLVMVAWVDRVSGLILTLTYEIHDVRTGQITARKSYDFRGDSDIAWNHAIDYMVRDIKREMTACSTNC